MCVPIRNQNTTSVITDPPSRSHGSFKMSDIIVRPDHHLGHIVMSYMRQNSDRLCQIDAATGQSETFKSVLSRSIHLAKCLRNFGFKSGDILAFGGNNHLDVHIPFYSALFNGLPIVGVDPYYKYDEIKTLFKITSPKVAFCEEESYNIYLNVSRDLGLNTKIITFGNGDNSLTKFLEEYGDKESEDSFKVAEFDTEEIYVFLMSTSGTTGKVKVAAFNHQPIVWKMLEFAGVSNNEKRHYLDTNMLNLSPVNWISSYFIAVAGPVLGQCRVQSSIPDNIDIIIDIINKYKPVSSLFSPSLVTSLLKRRAEVDLTCFMYIVLTGSKVYPDVLTELKTLMRKESFLFESYGQTENIGAVLKSAPGVPLGSCGKPYSTYTLKVIDPDTGSEITEPNVPGELLVKGPRFKEYYNDPEETAKVFTQDGFFKTGDLLYRDDNDFYFFVDRIKTLIKCRNFHVLPAELEDVIRTHEGVGEVCVIGVDDPEDGQRPVACIVPRNGSTVSAQEIKCLVTDKLSKHKELRGGVVFLKEFPTTSTGKIARKKLLEIVLNSERI